MLFDFEKPTSSGDDLQTSGSACKPAQQSATADPRYRELLGMCQDSWNRIHEAHGISPAPPFGFRPRDGKAVKDFLKSFPKSPVSIFEAWFRNRESSEEVNASAMPVKYLPNLCDFASGPLDRYGKPSRDVYPGPARRRIDGARKALAQTAIDRGLVNIVNRPNDAWISHEPAGPGIPDDEVKRLRLKHGITGLNQVHSQPASGNRSHGDKTRSLPAIILEMLDDAWHELSLARVPARAAWCCDRASRKRVVVEWQDLGIATLTSTGITGY